MKKTKQKILKLKKRNSKFISKKLKNVVYNTKNNSSFAKSFKNDKNYFVAQEMYLQINVNAGAKVLILIHKIHKNIINFNPKLKNWSQCHLHRLTKCWFCH